MDRVEVIPGLEPELVERVVARLRELEPSTVAVLVTGSYAQGTADEDSDLDVNVLTDGVRHRRDAGRGERVLAGRVRSQASKSQSQTPSWIAGPTPCGSTGTHSTRTALDKNRCLTPV